MSGSKSKLPKMAGYTIVSAAVFLVGLLVSRFLPGNILGVLQDLGAISLLASAAYYGYRSFLWLKNQLLWKVRNRIIVSFAFVGIIPLIILVLISSAVLFIIFKRLSGFYLERELEAITETLETTGQSILFAQLSDPVRSLDSLREHSREGLASIPPGLQNCAVHLYRKTGDSFRWIESIVNPEFSAGVAAATIPDWLRDGFSGIVSIEGQLHFTSAFDLDGSYRLLLVTRFDERTIEYFRRRTSLELALTPSNPQSSPVEFQEAYESVSSRQGSLAINGVYFFRPVDWDTGTAADSWSVVLSVPVSILLQKFFAQDTSSLLVIVGILLAAFIAVEVVSLLVGVTIARTITHSIHNIYSGLDSIQKGNLGVSIPSGKRDQLDAVADSFNEMSSSITDLMREISRREALEKELEIAKEVQTQLFPQQLPCVDRLEIAASCTPARQVSGDYYDFLPHSTEKLDVVVGDISGKGISAALLMASVQATIRSGLSEIDGEVDSQQRISRVVKNLNRQLYRRTTPESYSTLVLGHYNSLQSNFSYCNAGHHPPLLFSGGRVTGLTVGGTVVGLFEHWEFEAGTVQLKSGDLLLFFTDGVVESATPDGEQYGTERLIEIVRSNTFLTAEDIVSMVLQQVFDWSVGMEQADDITVVCLKVS